MHGAHIGIETDFFQKKKKKKKRTISEKKNNQGTQTEQPNITSSTHSLGHRQPLPTVTPQSTPVALKLRPTGIICVK